MIIFPMNVTSSVFENADGTERAFVYELTSPSEPEIFQFFLFGDFSDPLIASSFLNLEPHPAGDPFATAGLLTNTVMRVDYAPGFEIDAGQTSIIAFRTTLTGTPVWGGLTSAQAARPSGYVSSRS